MCVSASPVVYLSQDPVCTAARARHLAEPPELPSTFVPCTGYEPLTFVSLQMSRLAQQWREATYVKQLPLGSLAAAASVLFALALSERFIVGPMRKRQEALGLAPSVSIFGDIAVSRQNVDARQLPDGSMLLGDGSIVKKGASR